MACVVFTRNEFDIALKNIKLITQNWEINLININCSFIGVIIIIRHIMNTGHG